MVEAIEAPVTPSLLGEQIDNWKIVKMLGEGGMSFVYLGKHLWLEQHAAIKVLRPEFCRETAILQRFQQEALAASKLQHENIIEVSNFGKDPKHGYFMVLEYLEGVELDHVMDQAPLPKGWILPIVKQICSALHTTHQAQIIHRDLKPSNMYLLPTESNIPRVKLLDFGIAKVHFETRDQKLTSTGVIVGTPAYLAPEQVVPRRGLTHSADIYALGVVLYQMFTGQLPLFAESTIEHVIKVLQVEAPLLGSLRPEFAGTDLEAFLARMLEKQPENRPMTMQLVWEEFQRAAATFDDPLDVPASYPNLQTYMTEEALQARQSEQAAFETSAYEASGQFEIEPGTSGPLPTGGGADSLVPAWAGGGDHPQGPSQAFDADADAEAKGRPGWIMTAALTSVVVAMLGALGYFAWPTPPPPQPVKERVVVKPKRNTLEDLVFKGIKSLKKKKLKTAIKLMRQAIKLKKFKQSEYYPRLYGAMGKAHKEQKQLYSAVKYVDRYLTALQSIRKQQQELDARLQAATKAGRDQEAKELRASLGRLMNRIPQGDKLKTQLKAFASWKRALNSRTGTARGLIKQLLKQFSRGKLGDAHKTYLEIRELAPSHPGILMELAKALRKRFPGVSYGIVSMIINELDAPAKTLASLKRQQQALAKQNQADKNKVSDALKQAESAIALKKWRVALRGVRGINLNLFARTHSQIRRWFEGLKANDATAASKLWRWYTGRWQQLERKQLAPWVNAASKTPVISKALKAEGKALQRLVQLQGLWKQVQTAVGKGQLARAGSLNKRFLATWEKLKAEDKWGLVEKAKPLHEKATALQPRLSQSSQWVRRAQTYFAQARFDKAADAQKQALEQLRGTAAHDRWKKVFAQHTKRVERAQQLRKAAQYRSLQLKWRKAEAKFKAYLKLFPQSHDRKEILRKIKLCRCGYMQGSWEVCPTRDSKALRRLMRKRR